MGSCTFAAHRLPDGEVEMHVIEHASKAQWMDVAGQWGTLAHAVRFRTFDAAMAEINKWRMKDARVVHMSCAIKEERWESK
jgi:hypothetical protein